MTSLRFEVITQAISALERALCQLTVCFEFQYRSHCIAEQKLLLDDHC